MIFGFFVEQNFKQKSISYFYFFTMFCHKTLRNACSVSTTLGLISIQSLLHLAVYPALTWVLGVLDISYTLYHFHWTWHSPYSSHLLSAIRMFTCHRIYLTLVLTLYKYSVVYPVLSNQKSSKLLLLLLVLVHVYLCLTETYTRDQCLLSLLLNPISRNSSLG